MFPLPLLVCLPITDCANHSSQYTRKLTKVQQKFNKSLTTVLQTPPPTTSTSPHCELFMIYLTSFSFDCASQWPNYCHSLAPFCTYLFTITGNQEPYLRPIRLHLLLTGRPINRTVHTSAHRDAVQIWNLVWVSLCSTVNLAARLSTITVLTLPSTSLTIGRVTLMC